MLKSAFYCSLFLGVLFFVLYRDVGVAFLGIAFLIAVFFIAQKEPEILENWSTLIGGAQGKADQMLADTKEEVVKSEAPKVELVQEMLGPTLSTIITSDSRKFLICTNKIGLKFRSYKIFINAHDYGKNLFISWYLTHKPGAWETMLLLLPGAKQVLNIDQMSLFDRQDLNAYVMNVHKCFQKAMDKILVEFKIDPATIDRKTKGFLGIS